MNKSLTLNLELARRVELAEALVGVGCAQTFLRLRPQGGAAFERYAGGFAIYCGPSSPLTQAVALGLDGATTDAELDRLEAFYRDRNEPVRAEMCPLADGKLFARFGRDGYSVTEFTNVMAQAISPGCSGPDGSTQTSQVTVEKVADEQVDLWAETVADGFADHPPSLPEIVELMKMMALSPAVECYLGRVDGRAAGAGALSLRDGVATLFAASTLSAFRGRGVQTALLHARLARAAEGGADLAMCLAQPGSISQRNVVRQGFQVLYTRVKFEKAWG